MEVTHMAGNVNIFDKFGIKEVANVYFEALETDLKTKVFKGDIVLYLDTLKVSTIETTAESVDATGGWGNPKLITWDYGKEITVTLEDALLSLESLRFMMGGTIKYPSSSNKVIVRHTEEVTAEANGVIHMPKDHLTGKYLNPVATQNHPIRIINLGGTSDNSPTAGTRTQIVADTSTPVKMFEVADNATETQLGNATATIYFKNSAFDVSLASTSVAANGDHIRIFWDEIKEDNSDKSAVEVTISPDTYPGTYRVVGDTFMRSQKTGKDEAFQFVIDKAKVLSEVTLTLEAEGDPSTFEMQLSVLKSDDGDMMKLIRYGGDSSTTAASGDDTGSLTTPS